MNAPQSYVIRILIVSVYVTCKMFGTSRIFLTLF